MSGIGDLGDSGDGGNISARGNAFAIEVAAVADFPVLAQMYLDLRRQTMTWVPPERFQYGDFAVHAEGETIHVARRGDGEILGFVSVWPADDFIHMLYVRESSQGKGAGTALLRALPGWPTHRYRLKCLVNNARATAFYLRHGFVVVGTGVSEEGDYDEMASEADDTHGAA
ncbi:GNAT family N-acetyltransferase [Pandoraea pneumonica]|uniref:GNAT family N-acetyltransferase n=1 Tax=Pandoraea pneumonica TaxID=2508299 RepID=A0A5E4Z3Y1_9BURK|nr:GNAT family N-acetyltransferase [Pandoraea pneumonica]VVE55826.1 GNAT family N-acetyltransferase [Pandoraea pneumonica]